MAMGNMQSQRSLEDVGGEAMVGYDSNFMGKRC